jgi:hypothetical protein
MGFDPKAGAHSRESSQAQSLRQALVPLVAIEGRDPKLRAQLVTAAEAYVGGDAKALDVAFRLAALEVAVQDRGFPFMQRLQVNLLKSNDSLFRHDATIALGSANTPELAEHALQLAFTPGMQSLETVRMFFRLSLQPRARETLAAVADKNFKRLLDAFPGFLRPRIVELFGGYCSKADVARVDRWIQPNLAQLGGGELELAQTKERIALCATLKEAKGAEIGRALSH